MTKQRLEIPMGPNGEGLAIAPGISGWARYFDGSANPPYTRLRIGYESDAGGSLAIKELWIEMKSSRVAARKIRDLQLGRIEASVNAPGIRERVREHLAPANAVSFTPPKGDWDVRLLTMVTPERPLLTIPMPTTWKKPDEFYAAVANAFEALRPLSARPASEIAEANGVKVSTVHGWLKEARRRGVAGNGFTTGKGDKS